MPSVDYFRKVSVERLEFPQSVVLVRGTGCRQFACFSTYCIVTYIKGTRIHERYRRTIITSHEGKIYLQCIAWSAPAVNSSCSAVSFIKLLYARSHITENITVYGRPTFWFLRNDCLRFLQKVVNLPDSVFQWWLGCCVVELQSSILGFLSQFFD